MRNFVRQSVKGVDAIILTSIINLKLRIKYLILFQKY